MKKTILKKVTTTLIVSLMLVVVFEFSAFSEEWECPDSHEYDMNGFCWMCGDYQPITPVDGIYQITNAGQLYWFAEIVNSGVGVGYNAILTENIVVNSDFTFNPDTGLVEVTPNAITYYFGTGIKGNADGDNTQFDTVASSIGRCYNSPDAGDITSVPDTLRGWTPIGADTDAERYVGTFNGNGKTVSGLYYHNGDFNDISLFGTVGVGGKVKNLTVANSYLHNTKSTGFISGVCGINYGTIESCSYTGVVSGYSRTGGVCGSNDNIIKNCSNAGIISSNYVAGGVCAINESGIIDNCCNTGTVSGKELVGGVCGSNMEGTIKSCCNTGAIGSNKYVGGVCGGNKYLIENCYSTGTVNGTEYNIGGVCGANLEGIIRSCYNTGTLKGNKYVGSVCGYDNYSEITNCYYVIGSATDGNGTIQNGTGSYTIGEAEPDIAGETDCKTVAQFADGTVAFALNGSRNAGTPEKPLAWYQKLSGEDKDNLPTLTYAEGKTVYYGYETCTSAEKTISNEVRYSELPHSLPAGSNGFCTVCGGYQPAVLNKNGTEEDATDDYYEISNAGQLYWFAAQVNGGNNAINGKLMYDINPNPGYTFNADGSYTGGEAPREWTPIGNNTNKYAGTFDGDEKTVSGIYYNNSDADYVGLFGRIGIGTVSNIGVINSYLYKNQYVGGVCGFSSGNITNCSNAGTVSSDGPYVGGVCGKNNGNITNCYNDGTVSNCYYLDTSATCGMNANEEGGWENTSPKGEAESRTAVQFENGSIAWLLNGGDTQVNAHVWFQTIGTDDFPTLDSTHGTVYISSMSYDSDGFFVKAVYSNDNTYMLKPSKIEFKYEKAYKPDDSSIYEISSVGQLYWFVYQVNNVSGENAINGKLMNDICLNRGYSFSFDADTGLVIVEKDNTAIGCFGTGLNGADGKNTTFDITASTAGSFYLSSDSPDTGTKPDDLHEWTPIGVDTENGGYTGAFDGNGKTVSGLYFNSKDANHIGLFGYIGSGGKAENITVANAYINGNQYVGGVCGQNRGDITSCYSVGTVIGYEFLGGVCGNNSGNITSCCNIGTVSGERFVGGLCGDNNGNITSCYNTGAVNGCDLIGGVCGQNNDGTTANCYNTGAVSGRDNVGGVCGDNSGNITSCHNTGKVTEIGKDNSAGIVGKKTGGTISNCYYLDTSATCGINANDGGEWENLSPEGEAESRTAAQFASGEVAWLLNTAGKDADDESYIHTGIWSQGEECPIFADDAHKATYKVTLSGAKVKVYYTDATGKCADLEAVHISSISGITKDTVHAADASYAADIAIISVQPILGSSITMTYEANILTSLVGSDAPQTVFTYHGITYTVDGKAGTPVGDYTPYTFDFTEISPQCMGDSIDALLTIDGKTVTKAGYSLKAYCDKMLAKSAAELNAMLAGNENATADELKTLLSDILLYGAASQTYRDYKTDALVGNLDALEFEDLTVTDKAINGTKNDDAYFTAIGLWFDNINKIYWKIAINEENLQKLTVNVYRDGETAPCGTELTKVSDGIYIVYSEDITATGFGTKYRAVITYDGTEAQAVTYSVNSYVYVKQGEPTPIGKLVRALCNYGKSALAYNTAE